jgi:Recombination endonuclease VII
MNNCLKCNKLIPLFGKKGAKLKFCNVNCRCAYHSVKFSRKRGIFSKEETLKSLRGTKCGYKLCNKKFNPHTFGQEYCSPECRYKEGLRIRPKKTFIQKLRWNHHLSLEKYNVLYSKGCAICKKGFDHSNRDLIPCIDHNHNCCSRGRSCEKCRRGLIHSHCNLVLGHAKDNSLLLKQAARYLEKHEKIQM